VTPENFEQHLKVLRECSSPIGLQHLIQASFSGVSLPDRPVVVTFDDGYLDNLEQAKPLLERFEVPATLFLVASYIGHEGEFWWDELERLLLQPGKLPETLHLEVSGITYRWELGKASCYSYDEAQRNFRWRAWEDAPCARHRIYQVLWEILLSVSEAERRKALKALRAWAGVELKVRPTHRLLSPKEVCALIEGDLLDIGAHTMTHPSLFTLSVAAQWDEIQRSKTQLESILNRSVGNFAYPFGRQCDYLPETVRIVRDVGFTCACSNFPGFVDQFADRFQLPRLKVGDWDKAFFARQLEHWFSA
jgi:peptidoglycan/xylan/chitin deacetylase (PgdA/CDA1 family)